MKNKLRYGIRNHRVLTYLLDLDSVVFRKKCFSCVKQNTIDWGISIKAALNEARHYCYTHKEEASDLELGDDITSLPHGSNSASLSSSIIKTGNWRYERQMPLAFTIYLIIAFNPSENSLLSKEKVGKEMVGVKLPQSSDSRYCRNPFDSSSIPYCSFKRSGLHRVLCLDAKGIRVV